MDLLGRDGSDEAPHALGKCGALVRNNFPVAGTRTLIKHDQPPYVRPFFYGGKKTGPRLDENLPAGLQEPLANQLVDPP